MVVDSSIAVGAAVNEGPAVDALGSLHDRAALLFAPPLIWVETANALIRRHAFSGPDATFVLRSMERIGLETLDRGMPGLIEAMSLAERHRLSVCDASYLWLALDLGAELATLDAPLARAAEAEGVPLALSVDD
ncbi:MAG: type II toxin-antitoxin system VapC family toxin [Chloroflexota bacterium]